MRGRKDLRPYQELMIEHIKEHPFCALWVGMGAGKTATTLTALNDLMQDFEIGKTLIVAPLRVSRKVWSDEIKEWAHLNHLTVATLHGPLKQRKDMLVTPADIHTINRENLVWLIRQFAAKQNNKIVVRNWPWRTIVLDEARSFQSAKSQRFKWMRKLRDDGHIDRLIELTGTPATNGLMGLWAQVYLLDGGERLSKNITAFKYRYFDRNFFNPHIVRLRPGADQEIFDKVKDICMTLKPEDCVGLPEVVYNDIQITMKTDARKMYETMRKDMLIEMLGKAVTAANAGVLWNKLCQLANGFIYYKKGEWVQIHDTKIEELIDTLREIGEKAIVVYNFQADVDRITDYLSASKRANMLKFKFRVLRTEADEDAWNKGEIDVLLLHPASAGHGLNLHKSGARHIIHFGLNPDLDLYLQVNARLFGGHRGQGHKGTIHHLVMEGTIDEEIVQLLKDKETAQDRLLEATRRMVQEVKPNKKVILL
jgi:SNF2 family DNA or RNA helicase